MATGSQDDFTARLRGLLPARWFATTQPGAAVSNTPVLDAVLAGLSAAWASLYSLLTYARAQTRIATATDVFLDMIGADYFGTKLVRRANELDAAYRARIIAALLPPAGTRAALSAVVKSLVGKPPWIFEPRNTMDTGGYGRAGMSVGTNLGYGVAGGYGSLMLPYQCFVQTAFPTGGGIANVGGYYLGLGWAGGGYRVGALEYASTAMVGAQVTNADIYETISAVIPAGAIAWVNIGGLSAVAL